MAKNMIGQFRDWVATKPRDEAYDYQGHCGCAFYQFLKAAGYPVSAVGGWSWTDEGGVEHDIPTRLTDFDERFSCSPLTGGGDTTFGALADRLSA